MKFISRNPFTQELIAEHPLLSAEEVSRTVNQSAQAFEAWKRSESSMRATWLAETARILEERLDTLAITISQEMGKTLGESRAEINKCAGLCRYYAVHGESFVQPVPVKTEGLDSGFRFEPTGCVFGIMPWNFPFWQVFRYAIPALMAGNVCILKHAPNVLLCAKAIEHLFLDAGLPGHVFQSIVIGVDQVEQIISSEIVSGVAFTGSEAAGRSVAMLAGKYLKKVVLELGGSDPFLVLADADLEQAAKQGLTSRMINAGQACNGAKRFIVEKSVYPSFLALFLQEVHQIRQGDPFAPKTTMGPMARHDLVKNVQRQVAETLASGAKMVVDGPSSGCNQAPIVLTGVLPGMAAFDQETFGPLAALVIAQDEAHGIKLANQTSYGLGASVWTSDQTRAQKIIRQLDCGNVFVNGIVRSDPRLPFGGIKHSGYGRELSQIGMHEFMNLKTYYIQS